jgi:probable rRNA maturation factor
MNEPAVSVTIENAGAHTADGEPVAGLCGLDEATLRRVIALTLARVGVAEPVELSLVVTDDQALQGLNREYRGRDEATDVLSFPLLDAPLVRAPADQLWSGAEGAADASASAQERDTPGDPSVVSYSEGNAPTAREAGAERDAAAPRPFITPPELPTHLGDIVVARGVTERQAALAGHAAAWELAYLVAHGVLHLVGYDDHTDAGYTAMVAHQEAVLREAGIQR